MNKIDTVLHLRSSGAYLGAENVILEISKNSERYGFRSIVGAVKDVRDASPVFLDAARGAGLQTVVFENRKMLDLACASSIRAYIKENHVDVIHSHGYKEDFFGILSLSHVPKIATNHLWKNTTFKLRCYRLLDAFLLRFFDRVVGVSDELVSEMQGLGIKNVSKIANGIDIDRYVINNKSSKVLEQFAIPPDAVVLGMVSSLTPEKNHRIIFECLEKMNNPHLRLLIVGSGKQEGYLRDVVAQKGLDRQVIFAGRQENIAEILSVVNIYLLPSLAEGLPMSLLEAMACGKAVIASKVGENANVIAHQENGLIVRPGDLAELELSIGNLLHDPELIKKYGDKARQTVVSHFSSVNMAKKYCIIYARLLDREIDFS